MKEHQALVEVTAPRSDADQPERAVKDRLSNKARTIFDRPTTSSSIEDSAANPEKSRRASPDFESAQATSAR